MNEPDLAPIHRLLERLYETDKYPAIQICLRHRGEIVFHRAIGEYRPLDAPDTWRPADRDTRFLLFSLSKCVTATAMHILFDRGEICVDDPVHWYVPEFGRAGKEGITLRHLLTHTAGIPMVFWHLDDDLIADWDAVIEEICRQEPVHFPGRYTSYHVFSSGYILAEVLRRVDGRMIDEFLRDELLDPLEMETFDFGIDETFYDRTARVERVEDLPPRPVIAAASRILGVDLEEALAIVNRPVVHDSIIPAGNIIGTAEETSRFFQLLLDGGAYDERRLLSERQVRRATAEQVVDRDWTLLLTPQRYSLGFMLGRKSTPFNVFGPDTEQTYGHLGFTRALGWANPKNQVAGAILTNGVPVRPTRELCIYRKLQNTIRRTFGSRGRS